MNNYAILREKLCESIEKQIKGKADKEILKKLLLCKSTGKSTNPGEPTFRISKKSITETAFQRAIFSNKYSTLEFLDKMRRKPRKKRIKWLDLELSPILSDKARKPCIDLIGLKDDNSMVLCELKFRDKNNTNNPIYAVLELLIYYYKALVNCTELANQPVYHDFTKSDNKELRKIGANKIDWKNIRDKNTLLIVAANKEYWTYYLEGSRRKDYKENLFNLIKTLGNGLKCEIFLFSIPNPEKSFKDQARRDRRHDSKYEPEIKQEKWKQII